MFKFALAALLCAQAFAGPYDAEIESHIVGGNKAKETQFPFVVSIRQANGKFLCGGALISDRYVLTAANCVVNKNNLEIGAGSADLVSQMRYLVEKITIHADYDSNEINNDIALLKLKTPVKIGKNIQIINFPTKDNLEGKTLTVMGWGRTSSESKHSDILMYLSRPVIKSQECARRLGYNIYDTQICIDGILNSGMCLGDSGNPLVHKGSDGKTYIAGLASWGFPCANGYPDVFTRVSYFAKWIKENMA